MARRQVARYVRHMTLKDRIVDLVARQPGLTEKQIAADLYGDEGVQQRVNSACRALIKEGLIRRLGLGRSGQPFTYRLQGVKNA